MNSADFRSAIDLRLQEIFSTTPEFIDHPRATELCAQFRAPATKLVRRGKRTRALCVAGGYEFFSQTTTTLPLHAGVAVELYQASALVHDDIIDAADTRRGLPATHRLFSATHNDTHLTGSSEEFGEHAALLLGDYLLSLSSAEFARQEGSAPAIAAATQLFHRMTAETAFGQYLDMRAEHTPLDNDFATARDDALLVLLHKSARYSVELPVLLGAALAGGSATDLADLSRWARPLGEAFQLRDDELGIFGDPAITGKPAGSDITEQKRTVLLALTRQLATPAQRDYLDSCMGHQLSPTDVAEIREIMHNSGAYTAHEEMITQRQEIAQQLIPAHASILGELLPLLAQRRS